MKSNALEVSAFDKEVFMHAMPATTSTNGVSGGAIIEGSYGVYQNPFEHGPNICPDPSDPWGLPIWC